MCKVFKDKFETGLSVSGTIDLAEFNSLREGPYAEFNVGNFAKIGLGSFLESRVVSQKDIRFLQEKSYYRQEFDLDYPMLIEDNESIDQNRYYRNPLRIHGKEYKMCSQWVEK